MSDEESKLGASSPNQQKGVDAFMEVDVLLLGGSLFGGKSWLAATLSTLYAVDPNTRMAVFRTTLEQMKKGGAIIDTFKSVYKQIQDTCKLEVWGNPPVGKIVTGTGAGTRRGEGCRIDFIQMSKDSDIESIRGSAFDLAVIEEAIPNFTQEQIEMIISRNRSNSSEDSLSGLSPKVLITCNPHPDHFLCDFIKDYYLDKEGYPIQERCGDIRYYFKLEGDYCWGDSREEVYHQVKDQGGYEQEFQPLTKKERLKRIKSFSFVQLTARDNPIGMKRNPSYMASLEALDPVMKARNLYGNWFIRPENSGVFERSWLRGAGGERVKRLVDVPTGCTAMRGLDKAHAIPSEVNRDPDFTAISPLFLKDRNGFYWLLGNYISECVEPQRKKSDKKVLGRFRRLAGERDTLVAMQLQHDKDIADTYGYREPSLVIAKDSGAGTGDFNATLALMIEKGIKTIKDQTVSNVQGKKLKDFVGFCAACQNGMVFIVEESFDKETLAYIYSELEKFDGITSSTRTRKDDFVDAFSIVFNAIATSSRPYQTLSLAPVTSTTLVSNLIK